MGQAQPKEKAARNGGANLGPEVFSLCGGPNPAHAYGLGRIRSGPPPMLIISAET